MFGVHALSQQPHATQGFVKLGEQTLSGNFTETPVVIKIASGVQEISTTFQQSSAAQGVIPFIVEMSSQFDMTSTQTKLAVTAQDMNSQFDTTSVVNKIGTGVQDVSANFTLTPEVNRTASADQDLSGNFTVTPVVNRIGYGFSTQRTDSVKTSTPVYLRQTPVSYISQFDATSIPNRVREFSYSASFTFTKSSAGELLWEPLDPNGAPISITPPVGSGTWTEVDASVTVENWTEMIV